MACRGASRVAPDSIKNATNDYLKEIDNVAQFVKEIIEMSVKKKREGKYLNLSTEASDSNLWFVKMTEFAFGVDVNWSSLRGSVLRASVDKSVKQGRTARLTHLLRRLSSGTLSFCLLIQKKYVYRSYLEGGKNTDLYKNYCSNNGYTYYRRMETLGFSITLYILQSPSG